MKDNIFGRRDFLLRAPALLGVAAGSAVAAKDEGSETLIAKTTYGQLRGIRENGVVVFKGIPYAGPSDGANRFKPPTKLEPWTGVRDAVEYGPQAIQNRDPNAPSTAPVAPSSENCQFLNVWTPAVDGRKRPVMFYSHGGGFATGSGGWGKNPSHDGSALAKNYDVVVVTTNHRLGLVGYLYLGDILGEEYAASGITGMLDIVKALEWARDNIAAFGGDPGNVMIWGESGGGAKVSTLLAMPAAHGVFHKASIESGPGLRMIPREAANETTKALLADLDLTAANARELLKTPVSRLLAFQAKYVSATRGTMGSFGPVVDGHYLPSNPFDPVAPAISKNIPLIVGTNKDETIFMFEHGPEAAKIFNLDNDGLRQRVEKLLGPKADRTEHVIDVYRRSRPNASPTDLFVAISTAQWMWANAITLAERKVEQNGAPVYMYMFAYESEVPVGPGINYPMKSAHAMEMAFKFDHPENNPSTGKRPERFQAARNMSQAWATFARTSNPNFNGLPHWPAYDLKERATMILNAQCKVVNDPFREERLVWKEM